MRRSFDWVFALGPMLFAAAGCSDPVPNSAAAGLTLDVGTSGSCPSVSTFKDDIGSPPPTKFNSGNPVYNGEGGMTVRCTVSGSGEGPYAVSGTIQSSSPTVALSVNATGLMINKMGTAIISVQSANIGDSTVSSPADKPCRIETLAAQPGAVWAHFECPQLDSFPTSCTAFGEFVLQNCTK